MLLFAGGTTGLVLLGSAEPARSFCAALGEAAEDAGLSALAFAGAIPATPRSPPAGRPACSSVSAWSTPCSSASATRLRRRLRAATGDTFAALVLVEPRIREEELAPLLADAPHPQARARHAATDADAQATAAAAYRHAIGPLVVRHLSGRATGAARRPR